MKSDSFLSGINRRVLHSGLATLRALSGLSFFAAQTQTTQDSALSSWNKGPGRDRFPAVRSHRTGTATCYIRQ
jgi:hypothetical protein